MQVPQRENHCCIRPLWRDFIICFSLWVQVTQFGAVQSASINPGHLTLALHHQLRKNVANDIGRLMIDLFYLGFFYFQAEKQVYGRTEAGRLPFTFDNNRRRAAMMNVWSCNWTHFPNFGEINSTISVSTIIMCNEVWFHSFWRLKLDILSMFTTIDVLIAKKMIPRWEGASWPLLHPHVTLTGQSECGKKQVPVNSFNQSGKTANWLLNEREIGNVIV